MTKEEMLGEINGCLENAEDGLLESVLLLTQAWNYSERTQAICKDTILTLQHSVGITIKKMEEERIENRALSNAEYVEQLWARGVPPTIDQNNQSYYDRNTKSGVLRIFITLDSASRTITIIKEELQS